MPIDQSIAASAMRDILDQVGEEIAYQPKDEGVRTITAWIRRHPPEPRDYGSRAFAANAMELWFLNDATDGITTVTEKHDKITTALKRGGDEVELTVTKVIDANPGWWHCEAVA